MERYSELYGTAKGVGAASQSTGTYARLKASKGLAGFLKSLGSENNTLTLERVKSLLKGFKPLEDYDSQLLYDKPVAVCYAPLYLNRFRDMPDQIKPFQVISISGAEQLSRESVYTHTILMRQELLLEDGPYCYLDQIFGTRLTSWTDVKLAREDPHTFDCDALPQKVQVQIQSGDRQLVNAAVCHLLQGKRVVLYLEKGAPFNQRAWELLRDIYSLLPPVLAAGIGFATYTSELQRLMEETSIRLFVLPGGSGIPLPGTYELAVLQAGAPVEAAHSDLSRSIQFLEERLSWEQRRDVLAQLFRHVKASQLTPERYQEAVRSFASDPVFAWLREPAQGAPLQTAAEITALYDRFPLCKSIPWVMEAFTAKISQQLAPGLSLRRLRADVVEQSLEAIQEKQEAVCKQLSEQYAVLSQLDDYDIGPLVGNQVAAHIEKACQDRAKQEMAALLLAEEAKRRDAVARLEQEKAAAAEKARAELERVQTSAAQERAQLLEEQETQRQSAAVQLQHLKEEHSRELQGLNLLLQRERDGWNTQIIQKNEELQRRAQEMQALKASQAAKEQDLKKQSDSLRRQLEARERDNAQLRANNDKLSKRLRQGEDAVPRETSAGDKAKGSVSPLQKLLKSPLRAMLTGCIMVAVVLGAVLAVVLVRDSGAIAALRTQVQDLTQEKLQLKADLEQSQTPADQEEVPPVQEETVLLQDSDITAAALAAGYTQVLLDEAAEMAAASRIPEGYRCLAAIEVTATQETVAENGGETVLETASEAASANGASAPADVAAAATDAETNARTPNRITEIPASNAQTPESGGDTAAPDSAAETTEDTAESDPAAPDASNEVGTTVATAPEEAWIFILQKEQPTAVANSAAVPDGDAAETDRTPASNGDEAIGAGGTAGGDVTSNVGSPTETTAPAHTGEVAEDAQLPAGAGDAAAAGNATVPEEVAQLQSALFSHGDLAVLSDGADVKGLNDGLKILQALVEVLPDGEAAATQAVLETSGGTVPLTDAVEQEQLGWSSLTFLPATEPQTDAALQLAGTPLLRMRAGTRYYSIFPAGTAFASQLHVMYPVGDGLLVRERPLEQLFSELLKKYPEYRAVEETETYPTPEDALVLLTLRPAETAYGGMPAGVIQLLWLEDPEQAGALGAIQQIGNLALVATDKALETDAMELFTALWQALYEDATVPSITNLRESVREETGAQEETVTQEETAAQTPNA